MSRKSRQRGTLRLNELRLRVMAEYDASGIWVIGQIGYFRHGMIEYSSLNLPSELSERFSHWITTYWAYYDQSIFDEEYPELKGFVFGMEAFNQEGRELARRLKAHVGPECYVEFVPESSENNGLGEVEVID